MDLQILAQDAYRAGLYHQGTPGVRIDANESAILARQLEFVKRTVYEVKYPEMMSRRFVPASPEGVPAGADTISYDEFDQVGDAKIIANFADDLPEVDTFKVRVTGQVHWIGARYRYSLQDLQRAAFSGVPLSVRKALAARRAIEKTIDTIIATGNSLANLPGFINNSNITPITVTSWDAWVTNDDADDMIKFMTAGISAFFTQTMQTFQCDTVLLDPISYDILALKPRATGSDMTVLQFILETQRRRVPGFDIFPWHKLQNAGAGGTISRAIFYARNPEVLSVSIPQEYTELPPQAVDLAFRVPAYAKTAGVELHQPLAVVYADGADQ